MAETTIHTPTVVLDAKDARRRAKEATQRVKLETRACNSRAAEALSILDGWGKALTLVARAPLTDDAVKRAAKSFDKAQTAKRDLYEAAAGGEDDATVDAYAVASVEAADVLKARKSEIRALAKEGPLFARALFAASVENGLISPTSVRKQLADAGLARNIEKEVSDARLMLEQATDALARKAGEKADKAKADKAKTAPASVQLAK